MRPSSPTTTAFPGEQRTPQKVVRTNSEDVLLPTAASPPGRPHLLIYPLSWRWKYLRQLPHVHRSSGLQLLYSIAFQGASCSQADYDATLTCVSNSVRVHQLSWGDYTNVRWLFAARFVFKLHIGSIPANNFRFLRIISFWWTKDAADLISRRQTTKDVQTWFPTATDCSRNMFSFCPHNTDNDALRFMRSVKLQLLECYQRYVST